MSFFKIIGRVRVPKCLFFKIIGRVRVGLGLVKRTIVCSGSYFGITVASWVAMTSVLKTRSGSSENFPLFRFYYFFLFIFLFFLFLIFYFSIDSESIVGLLGALVNASLGLSGSDSEDIVNS